MSFLRNALLTCSGLLTFTYAAGAHAETVGAAVEAALNQHPAVQAAFANHDAYMAERDEKNAGYYPRLNVTAQGGRMYGDNSTSRGLTVDRGAGYSWVGEGSVTLSQMLFDGFETRHRVDAADLRSESAMAGVTGVREELALKTVLAYLDVMRTREALEAVRSHHGKIADYRGRIGKMVEQGAADKAMGVQAHDIHLQLEANMADIEGQYRTALAQYQEMTGRAPSAELSRPVMRPEMIPATVDQAIAYARKTNPMLNAKQLQGEGMMRDAKAERGILYPDVNADLSYMQGDKDDILGGEIVDARAVVKLNWSLSTGGAEQARIRRARYRAAEGRAQAEDMARQIARDVEIAWTEMDKAQKQYELQRQRAVVSSDLFTNYQSQFEGARVNLLQLLQADNGHFNARLAMLNAEYRQMAAHYNMLASMGRLQEALKIVPTTIAANGAQNGG